MRRASGAIALLVLVAGCSAVRARPTDSVSALTHPQLVSFSARYLAIAAPANDKLEDAFDGLEGGDEHDLIAAHKDYRLAAATERAFDRRLLAVAWPPAIEATARAMVRVNEARASLTDQAGDAATVDDIEALKPDLAFADRVVEDQVDVIRDQLGLPPPATD